MTVGRKTPRADKGLAVARQARMVAHEVRNALVPVNEALQRLYRDLSQSDSDAALQRYRSRIDNGLQRVFDFVRRWVEVATLPEDPPSAFELAPAVQDARAEVIEQSGATIKVELPDTLPAIEGHRHRFLMALTNLLRNAAQACTDADNEILVSISFDNGSGFVLISVEDRGPGIPDVLEPQCSGMVSLRSPVAPVRGWYWFAKSLKRRWEEQCGMNPTPWVGQDLFCGFRPLEEVTNENNRANLDRRR